MEDEWIGPWGCLLLGERLDAESLEKFAVRMSNCLNSQCDFMNFLKLNHHCSEKKNAFEVNLPYIDPFHAYYLLNPSGYLNYTQQRFEEWFRNHKWEGKAGYVPTIEELILALQNHDLYLYFSHGSGMQYIRADSFGKLNRCAAAFLMGCSSGSLRQRGSYAPHGALLYYLYAGSPTVIANLWEVFDKDIDRFAEAIPNSWTQDSILDSCNKCGRLAEDSNEEKAILPSRRIVEKEKCRYCEAKLRVASFISQAKGRL